MRNKFLISESLTEFFGWYGVVAILVAYALVSFNYIGAQSFLFQILNLSGSAGIAVDALKNKDRPAAVLNIIYALIGVIAIIRIFNLM